MKVEIGPYEEDRKVDIQLDKWDTWSMDHTLALIIHPMLIQLKETNHGYPGGLTEESWDEIMDKMIWSFGQLLDDDYDEQFYTGECDIQWKPLDNGYSEAFYGPNHTRVHDVEGHKKHEDRIQEGLDLFGKYFRNLWD